MEYNEEYIAMKMLTKWKECRKLYPDHLGQKMANIGMMEELLMVVREYDRKRLPSDFDGDTKVYEPLILHDDHDGRYIDPTEVVCVTDKNGEPIKTVKWI